MNIVIMTLVLLVSMFCSSTAWSEESSNEASTSAVAVTEEGAKTPEPSTAAPVEEETSQKEETAKAPEPSLAAPTEEAAYGEEFAPYTLGEVVVTGEAVRDVSIVNEVTADEITSTNSRTVPEALTFVPGVQVTSGRKNEPNISVHGFGLENSLVLIDGVPYYETNYGKLNLTQINSDIIARIDVTKGAPSVIYGPNALISVINIVTKEATERPYAAANVEVGDNDYNREWISHGMRAGIFNYWVNVGHNESDGWRLSDNFDSKLGSLVRRPGGTTEVNFENGGFRNNSDYEIDNIWAKFGVEPNEDSKYFVNFYYIDSNWGMPPSIVSNSVFTSRPAFSQLAQFEDYDDWGIDLSGEQKIFEGLTLRAKVYYHDHLDKYVSFSDPGFDDEISASTFKDHYVGTSLFADIKPVDWDIVRLAFHYKEDTHEERADGYLPYQKDLSHTGSVAIENEFDLIENLSVIVGTSLDWFKVTDAETNLTDGSGNFIGQQDLKTEDTESEFNPMIGANYTFPDSTRLFASVAKKSRFPTLQQLFSGRSGNPGLNAERTINYTVGVSRPFFDISNVQLAFFAHNIRDWISRDTPDPLGIYQNYGKINVDGIELSTQLYPTKNLVLTVDYTYLNARDESSGHVTDRVVHMPENEIDFGATYTVPCTGTRLDFHALWVDDTYSQLPTPASPTTSTLKNGDYYLLNVRISQAFLDHFEAYLAIDNLTDQNYEPEDGFPAPGRTIWVGMNARY